MKFMFLSCVSVLAVAQQAYAQDTLAPQPASEAAAPQNDDAIVVTARRREESLQDVPISITALSGDALKNRGVRDSLDLQSSVPSLSVTSQSPNRAALGYAIRGQRSNEQQLLTDPPVGVYFAEVVMPRPYGMSNSFYDLRNVQVLKGVQGTLFGRNMTGGAVLIEPEHPNLNNFGGYVQGQYGNYNMVDLEGAVNLPIVSDVFAVRASGKYRDRDGYTTDVSSGRKFDDEHFYSFRVSAEINTGNFRNYAVFDYYKQNINGAGIKLTNYTTTDPINGNPTVIGQQIGASPFFPVAAGVAPQNIVALANAALALGKYKVDYGNFGVGPLYANRVRTPFQKVRNWGITNRTELDVGDVTFRNIFGYRESSFQVVGDYDGFGAALIQPDQFARPRQISEEFQMLGKPFGDKFQLTMGAYYFREWGRDGSINSNFPQLTAIGFASPRPPATTNPLAGYFLNQPADFYESSSVGDAVANSWAVYAAGTYQLTDEFSFAGGIRYNRDSRSLTLEPFYTRLTIPLGGGAALVAPCNYDGLGTYTRDNCSQDRLLKNDAVTWDATVQYQPNRDVTAYAAIRRGYRAGGFSLRGTTTATTRPFQPETVLEYEVGVKNNFHIGSARLNTSAALFYQDYKDVQKQNAILVQGQSVTVVTNTTAQENYGGEFEASLSFPGGLSLNAFYSLVKIKIKEGGAGSLPYQGIPKHQLGGGIAYSRDLDFGVLNANLNGSYRSGAPLDEYDVVSYQKGYALFNARLGVDKVGGSGIGIAAFVRNITNRYYKIGSISLESNGPIINGVNPGGGVGFSSAVYGDPRTYGVEASFKF
ncbi:TonB-dependent receptor [Sphingobium sp. HBC34]|uniref:TonB-dependent receptor n=1 Tax=Sphingobium cyanobacteriorum TaxID=3063954 RepID=A0ABT8ZRK7_9SPHN|nr:TonB-dependent receptor [Sphingobium sp. HBC34]MDO7836350.1 TonB-dependent receptor [Sphingobium sp. HBC34]